MAFEYQQDLEQDRFLPASLEDRLVSMLVRLGGIIACVLLAACWVSLITWSAADPSLTQANGGSVRNLLGMPGAVSADLLLQTFGLAAVFALLAPSLWAVELVSERRIEGLRTKITYYPLAVVLLAGALSSLPVVISWPLYNGFGGILGDGLYGALRNIVSLGIPKHSGLICSFALFVLGGISLCYAAGSTLRGVAGAMIPGSPIRKDVVLDDTDRSGSDYDDRLEPAFGGRADFAWDRSEAGAEESRDALLAEPVPAPRHSTSSGWAEADNGAGAFGRSPAYAMADEPGFTADYPQSFSSEAISDSDTDASLGRQSPYQPQFERAPLFIRKSVEEQQRQSGGATQQPQRHSFVAGSDFDFDHHTEENCAEFAKRFAPESAGADRESRARADGVVEAEPFSVAEMLPAYDTRDARVAKPAGAMAEPGGHDRNGFSGVGHPSRSPESPAEQSFDDRFQSRGSAPWQDEVPVAHLRAPGHPGPGAGTPRAGQMPRGSLPGPVAPEPGQQRAAGPGRFQPKPGGTTMMGGMTFHRAGPPAYRRPSLNLLKRPAAVKPGSEFTPAAMRGTARLLEDVLADFGIKGEIRDIKPGPVVTLFEFEPARGVKSSRVIGLADDIARSMSATSARIGIVPGRNVIGIELPNTKRETVLLRELFEAEAFRSSDAALPIALGKSIGGDPIVADLARMPHLLVAGTTGSGKSVGVNAMILSLLYRYGPEQCRFLMIDPKMLELSIYNEIPHLLCPVVTDAGKAVNALNWVVGEMEERYKRMSLMSVRNVDVFNNRVRNAKKRGEMIARTVQTGFDRRTGKAIYEHEQMDLEPMPYIVVVIDEFADLMSVAGKDVEAAVQRLAQMARAAGIHLIMATQRPSVDVITGTIKANFPTRISFKVASKVDSRTILNEQGAEQLLGLGDMLYSAGSGSVMRVHGPFVADEEVEAIAKALRESGRVNYVAGVTDEPRFEDADATASAGGSAESDLYDRAVAIVLRDRKASTSYLQRRLAIGYNRAADLIERMERDGLISAPNGVNKREILAPSEGGE